MGHVYLIWTMVDVSDDVVVTVWSVAGRGGGATVFLFVGFGLWSHGDGDLAEGTDTVC